LILFFIFILLLPDSSSDVSSHGYDEEKFQDYVNSQYEAEFGASTAYEDNLLLTVLVEDDAYYNYYYIAWVGDHIDAEINYLLGNNDTMLGRIMESCISVTSYKYSLDSDLARAIDILRTHVTGLNLDDSFTCTEEHAQVKSHLINYSSIEMTEETVNDALITFTAETGIPVVVVVEDMDDVFGVFSSGDSGMNVTMIAIIAAVVIGVIAIVITIRRQKFAGAGFETEQKDSSYHEFDDQN